MNASRVITLAAAAALSVLAGCAPRTETTAVVAAPAETNLQQPVASIIDLMDGQVDPAADFIWESVAIVSTPKGLEEHQPRTEEEWKVVRQRALQLAEAANLLMMPGRVIAHPGQTLADEGTEGNLTHAQAEKLLKDEHASFVAFARALQETAVKTIAAIDKRDIDGYLQVGGEIDEACEGCHLKFWYPGSQAPPVAAAVTR